MKMGKAGVERAWGLGKRDGGCGEGEEGEDG
jgi:hypothetical protein